MYDFILQSVIFIVAQKGYRNSVFNTILFFHILYDILVQYILSVYYSVLTNFWRSFSNNTLTDIRVDLIRSQELN